MCVGAALRELCECRQDRPAEVTETPAATTLTEFTDSAHGQPTQGTRLVGMGHSPVSTPAVDRVAEDLNVYSEVWGFMIVHFTHPQRNRTDGIGTGRMTQD